MNNSPFKDALNAGIELMEEADTGHVHFVGGYPAEIDTLPGFVIRACVDHNDKPRLEIYRNADVVSAYRGAMRDMANGDFEELTEAFRENWPLEKWRADEMRIEEKTGRNMQEAKRIGAAFGVDKVVRIKDCSDTFQGHVGDVWVFWEGWGKAFPRIDLRVSIGTYMGPICRAYKIGEKWTVTPGGDAPVRDLMAQGLYCLGIENEIVDTLSMHERMEYRERMPRELWPEQWKEEAPA